MSRPRTDTGPESARAGRRVLARLIDSAVALGAIAGVVVGGPHGRPLAQDLLIVGFVVAIEVAMLTRSGATIGMATLDLGVTRVDGAGPPDLAAALRRTVPVALCYAVLPPGILVALIMPVALLVSVAWSPDRRGFHDRASGTVVVEVAASGGSDRIRRAVRPVDTVHSPWGRVPGVFERRRARAHRLDGMVGLAAAIAAAGIALVGLGAGLVVWVGLTVAWLVVLIVDETRHIARDGATPGHARYGYRVVDATTGRVPTTGRAFLRALVVIPMSCVPPLQALLVVWIRGSVHNRGPHDLIAGTVVVDPSRPAPRSAPPPPPVPDRVPPPHGTHGWPPSPPPVTAAHPVPPPVPGPF